MTCTCDIGRCYDHWHDKYPEDLARAKEWAQDVKDLQVPGWDEPRIVPDCMGGFTVYIHTQDHTMYLAASFCKDDGSDNACVCSYRPEHRQEGHCGVLPIGQDLTEYP